MKGAPRIRVQPRIRVFRGDDIVLGPGKADLLGAIRKLGSIQDAARSLGMSYMRAWKLVQTMNRGFREPVVTAARGGASHGGAVLTKTGEAALACYREMEAAGVQGMAPAWRRLSRRIKE